MAWLDYDIDPEPTSWHVLGRCLLYLTVNSAQPMLVDLMKYHGAATASTFVYILPTYYAMILVGLFKTNASIWESDWKKATFVSITDLSHQLVEKVGLVFAGSAAYMVASSSSVIWTAALSILILRRHIGFYRWMGISLIGVGLALQSLHLKFSFGNDEFFGIILTISAACLHALSYVCNESFLTGKNAIEGPNLVCMIGIINSSILTLWTVVWTLPRWDSLFVKSIAAQGGSSAVVIMCFVALLICAFIRSATLWYLLKHVGAVSSGVLKGARCAIVIVLSHVCFRHLQDSQRLTPVRAASALVCASGVVLYSVAGAKRPADLRTKKERLEGVKEEKLPSSSVKEQLLKGRLASQTQDHIYTRGSGV